MTEQDRPGTYNPFEDTGDWPFRESGAPAPPRETEETEQPPSSPGLFDREAHEPEPQPEPEPVPQYRVDELIEAGEVALDGVRNDLAHN